MQKRDLMSRETVPGDEERKLIDELTGLTDISMKRQALALCRRFLRVKWSSSEGFFEVVRVIGMFGSRSRWAPRLEVALVRQSARMRKALQGTMLTFYVSSGDWDNAVRYASMRRDLLPHEIAFSIEAFARAGRLREVRLLGKRIDRWIDAIILASRPRHSMYELGFLYYGFGFFKAHGYEVEEPWLRESARGEAVTNWNCVAPDHPLGSAAASNSSDLLLFMALENVKSRIQSIEHACSGKFVSTGLSLPGNQEKLTARTLARFVRQRRILERLVPEKRRKALGMAKPLYDE